MRKNILLFITLVPFMTSTYAYDCKVGNIYYDLNRSERTASVTYRNDPFYYNNYSGIVDIPSTIAYEGVFYDVTSIGAYAFSRSNISSVIIGDNVTSIGENAFSFSGLTSVTIGKSVNNIYDTAFSGCKNLRSVSFHCKKVVFDVFNEYLGLNVSSVYIGKEVEYLNWGVLYWGTTTSIQSIHIEDLSAWCTITFIGLPITEDYGYETLPYQKHTYEYYYNNKLITDLVIPNDVTTISNGAFPYGNRLTSITIPASVTAIGDDVFRGCSSLNSLIIPNSVTSIGERAFAECSSLSSLVINDGNNKINLEYDLFSSSPLDSIYIGRDINYNSNHHKKNSPFEGQIQLTSVSFGDSVTSIIHNAFNGCENLESVTIGKNVKTIGSSAFSGCTRLNSMNIGNSVNYIGDYAFSGCISLTSVSIPDSVTQIESGAFLGCNSLASVIINCPKIGSWFRKFISLKELIIGNGVTSISSYAFQGCTNLTSVSIGNGVTSIGGSVFSGCTSLTSLTIGNRVSRIDSQAFEGCRSLTSLSFIPNSVTSIGEGAFRNCLGLTSLDIPNSVISIGTNAFEGCLGLTSLNLPNSIISIGYHAFKGCNALNSMTIPKSVKNIYPNAFEGCNNLSFVIDENDIPAQIYNSTFPNSTNAILVVPRGYKLSYQIADYWKDFKKIVEFGDVNIDDEVDILDVVEIARYVVGIPSEFFVEILADINKDNIVNLGDAVTLVNDIAGDQNFVKSLVSPVISENNMLTLMAKDGNISLYLKNERLYTAFQFDLYVPAGTDVAHMSLNTKRRQQHQLLYNKVKDGYYRVAALSTSNNEFIRNDEELLIVALNGIYDHEVSIRNIHFFDVKSNDYLFDDIEVANTTSLNSLTPALSKGEGDVIYDLQGRKRLALQRGVNIVGSKKVVIK